MANVSVESAIVMSAASMVVPFMVGVGSVSVTCGVASAVGSAMLCVLKYSGLDYFVRLNYVSRSVYRLLLWLAGSL